MKSRRPKTAEQIADTTAVLALMHGELMRLQNLIEISTAQAVMAHKAGEDATPFHRNGAAFVLCAAALTEGLAKARAAAEA